jgi:hypothetical protein
MFWKSCNERELPGGGSMILNIYLTTGTIGPCLDHPTRGIRLNCFNDSSAIFFDNQREHTGKGYYTKEGGGTNSNNTSNSSSSSQKKRKVASDGHRTCLKCGTKSNQDYSKNQRRKGLAAKCSFCV